MSTPATPLLVVDTCAIAHYYRQNATGMLIEERFPLSTCPERPILSTIVEGEMRALARKWNWGNGKLEALESLFTKFVRLDPGAPEIVKAYAELYCVARDNGNPCGENDLWIAATALVTSACILTCDKDFLWLDPNYVSVCYIPQVG